MTGFTIARINLHCSIFFVKHFAILLKMKLNTCLIKVLPDNAEKGGKGIIIQAVSKAL